MQRHRDPGCTLRGDKVTQSWRQRVRKGRICPSKEGESKRRRNKWFPLKSMTC